MDSTVVTALAAAHTIRDNQGNTYRYERMLLAM